MRTGEKIKNARKKAGTTALKLAEHLGISKSAMSVIESDDLKNGVAPITLVKIAAYLNDLTILDDYCQACPVRQHLFIKQFPDLNNIRRDPAIIAGRLRKEMVEAQEAAERLAERYSDRDFRSRPGFQADFDHDMEQIVDVQRAIEILKFELVLSGSCSGSDLQRVHARQQQKCESHGHHHPDQTERSA